MENTLSLIDSTDELQELIAEYSLERVEAMDNLYPNSDIRVIEQHLDAWKEQSLQFRNFRYIKKFGDYFEFNPNKL